MSVLSSFFARESVEIMGILNATPDSFSDGGQFNRVHSALLRIEEMIRQGATIIDVGGESTRPYAPVVSKEEELSRVVPILKEAIPRFGTDVLFSIDTTKYEVASQALDQGVHIINDVSGLQKAPEMARLAASYRAAYLVMHSQGSPQDMQDNPSYEHAVTDIVDFLVEQISYLQQQGVEHIIVDPGIGFGKTLDHNLQIIAQLERVVDIGFPVLLGASRKSMFGQLLDDRPVEGRLAGTLAAHYHALLKGVRILRVHDVQEATDTVRVFEALQSAGTR
ncbi:MAG: dihydropteroate synthase [Bacteroidota bacterium]